MPEFTSTIKNGLPVIVEFTWAPAEPDVGIMSDYIDELIVKWPSGHKIGFEIPEKDMERLYNEAFEVVREEQEIRRCIRKYGYEKCYDAGII